MYRTLFLFQKSIGQPNGYTLGVAGHDCSHIIGVLRSAHPAAEFKVGPLTLLRYPLRQVLNQLRLLHAKGASTFQIYDGGLRELIVALHLARRFNATQIVFNFHWAVQWVELLQSTDTLSRALVLSIVNCLKRSGVNLRLSAESARFAELVEEKLEVKCEIYPVFSALDSGPTLAWSSRPTDVLFLPQRASEIPFVMEVVNRLALDGFSSAVATRREVWQTGRRIAESRGLEFDAKHPPQIFETPLGDADYRRVLVNSKTVVLPYDKPYFEWGSSGKFNEAICLGSFPLVPSNTSIASQSKYAAGDHCYEVNQIHDLMKKLRRRLELGFPPQLTGIEVSDFLNWIDEGATSLLNRGQPQSKLSLRDLLWLQVTSSLWRPHDQRFAAIKKIVPRVPTSGAKIIKILRAGLAAVRS